MKIAFINGQGENLGLEYISAVLKAGGHQVRLFVDNREFDSEYLCAKWFSRIFSSDKKVLQGLKEYKPDLIAISTMTLFYPWACQIAKTIKQHMDVPIIFGGIHPTSVPERVIKNDFIDMICLGEGEYPMLELADSMQKGKIDYSIKNIWFKKEGKVIRNEIRSFIEDLDALPFPDKELFYLKYKHYSETYYIMSSRGCFFSCSYCCHSYFKKLYKGKGNYFRLRSVNNVIEELKFAKEKYHTRYVMFFDDNFGADEIWLRDFSSQYSKFIGLPFTCMMHPVHINDKKVKYLSNMALCEVQIGVQSFNSNINKQIFNRHHSIETVEKAITLFKKYNIRCVVDNIIGVFTETEKDWFNMAEFYNKNRPTKINLFWLKFFPKVAITEWARENNLLKKSEYESIMDGISCADLFANSGVLEKDSAKLNLFIRLMLKLPKGFVSFILRRRLYRFFPVINIGRIKRNIYVFFRYIAKSNGDSPDLAFKISGAWYCFLRNLRK